MMTNNFKEGLKKDEDFKNSMNCWICDNVDGDVKLRDHCHIIEKYRGSAHRDCIIKGILNNKIPFIFHNLKNYDSHFNMQELGNLNFKVNVIPNRLE